MDRFIDGKYEMDVKEFDSPTPNLGPEGRAAKDAAFYQANPAVAVASGREPAPQPVITNAFAGRFPGDVTQGRTLENPQGDAARQVGQPIGRAAGAGSVTNRIASLLPEAQVIPRLPQRREIAPPEVQKTIGLRTMAVSRGFSPETADAAEKVVIASKTNDWSEVSGDDFQKFQMLAKEKPHNSMDRERQKELIAASLKMASITDSAAGVIASTLTAEAPKTIEEYDAVLAKLSASGVPKFMLEKFENPPIEVAKQFAKAKGAARTQEQKDERLRIQNDTKLIDKAREPLIGEGGMTPEEFEQAAETYRNGNEADRTEIEKLFKNAAAGVESAQDAAANQKERAGQNANANLVPILSTDENAEPRLTHLMEYGGLSPADAEITLLKIDEITTDEGTVSYRAPVASAIIGARNVREQKALHPEKLWLELAIEEIERQEREDGTTVIGDNEANEKLGRRSLVNKVIEELKAGSKKAVTTSQGVIQAADDARYTNTYKPLIDAVKPPTLATAKAFAAANLNEKGERRSDRALGELYFNARPAFAKLEGKDATDLTNASAIASEEVSLDASELRRAVAGKVALFAEAFNAADYERQREAAAVQVEAQLEYAKEVAVAAVDFELRFGQPYDKLLAGGGDSLQTKDSGRLYFYSRQASNEYRQLEERGTAQQRQWYLRNVGQARGIYAPPSSAETGTMADTKRKIVSGFAMHDVNAITSVLPSDSVADFQTWTGDVLLPSGEWTEEAQKVDGGKASGPVDLKLPDQLLVKTSEGKPFITPEVREQLALAAEEKTPLQDRQLHLATAYAMARTQKESDLRLRAQELMGGSGIASRTGAAELYMGVMADLGIADENSSVATGSVALELIAKKIDSFSESERQEYRAHYITDVRPVINQINKLARGRPVDILNIQEDMNAIHGNFSKDTRDNMEAILDFKNQIEHKLGLKADKDVPIMMGGTMEADLEMPMLGF